MNYQMFPVAHYFVNLYACLFSSPLLLASKEETHSRCYKLDDVYMPVCLTDGGGKKVDGAKLSVLITPFAFPFLPSGPPLISLQAGEGEK